MKGREQESPHQKLIITSTPEKVTPRSSDKKVKENSSPLFCANPEITASNSVEVS